MNKFSIHELFNNSKGKTSVMLLSAFMGICVSLSVFATCGFVMIVLVLHESKNDVTLVLNNVLMQSVALFTLSSGMLVTRRFTNDKEIKKDE